MKDLVRRLAAEDDGNAPLAYVLGLLTMAAVAQPSVALGLLNQAEILMQTFYGQLVSLF